MNRIIPCLLYDNGGLYKTIKFKDAKYIGDPLNSIKIFNEKEVDELIILDIFASKKNTPPDFKFIENIASECFMPLSYGGGITRLEQISRIMSIGVEKVSINTESIMNPSFVEKAANIYGSQAIVVSIDYKKNFFGKLKLNSTNGFFKKNISLIEHVKTVEEMGAGEILLTSIDNEGTWEGYDLDVLQKVCDSVSIPVIANGGAGCLQHLVDAIKIGNASAVALGSMAVFQKKGMGVLINCPSSSQFEKALNL